MLFGTGGGPLAHQNVTSKQVPEEAERLARIIVFFDYSGLIFFTERMKEKRLHSIEKVSEIMRRIPSSWMEAHTVYP